MMNILKIGQNGKRGSLLFLYYMTLCHISLGQNNDLVEIKTTNRFIASGNYGGIVKVNGIPYNAGNPGPSSSIQNSNRFIVNQNGVTIGLEAVNNQSDGTGYNCFWDNSINLTIPSRWVRRAPGSSVWNIANGTPNSIINTFTVTTSNINSINNSLYAPIMLRRLTLTTSGVKIPENTNFTLNQPITFTERTTNLSITAPDSICENGTTYFFEKWSDNVYSKDRLIPNTTINLNLTANFLRAQQIVVKYISDSVENLQASTSNRVLYGLSITLNPPITFSDSFGRIHYFQKWSDGDTSRIKTFSNVTTDDTVTAEYKGFRLSNIPELAGKSRGSRTVAIDAGNSNYWYQVYESNNAIWLSYSTNAGASWQPEVKLGDGKNPSIAGGGVVWVYGGIYFRTVGFLDGNLNLGSTWSSNNQNPGQPGSLYIDPIPDAHPCIAYKRESDGSWSYYIVYEHRIR
jgi:hypothetical protein